MTVPDHEKHGYEPEYDSKHGFSYVNKNYRHGLPYRIEARVNGEGGWGVQIDWKPTERHAPDAQTTFYGNVEGTGASHHMSERETRYDAATLVERAMREYSEENYGPRPSSDDFDITGGL